MLLYILIINLQILTLGQLADVDLGLVQTCLQNLLCYKVIKMIPTFQYGNMYCVTPDLHSKLVEGDPSFRNECLYFVARSEHVSTIEGYFLIVHHS